MNTLRHMFEHNSRFLELSTWILEVLIASMIAYELGSAIWHKWRSKQRFKQLYKLLQQGQGLHWSAPHYSAHDMAWEGRVKESRRGFTIPTRFFSSIHRKPQNFSCSNRRPITSQLRIILCFGRTCYLNESNICAM